MWTQGGYAENTDVQGLMKTKCLLCVLYLPSVTAFPDVTYLQYNNQALTA